MPDQQPKKIQFLQVPDAVWHVLSEYYDQRSDVECARIGKIEDLSDCDLVVVTKKDLAGMLSDQGAKFLLLGDEKKDSAALAIPLSLREVAQEISSSMEQLISRLPEQVIMGDRVWKPLSSCLESLDGEQLHILTDKENDILAHLYRCAGTPASRENLLSEIWSYHPDVETHTLETHMYRLRKKVEKNPDTPEIIITKSDGYLLDSVKLQMLEV